MVPGGSWSTFADFWENVPGSYPGPTRVPGGGFGWSGFSELGISDLTGAMSSISAWASRMKRCAMGLTSMATQWVAGSRRGAVAVDVRRTHGA